MIPSIQNVIEYSYCSSMNIEVSRLHKQQTQKKLVLNFLSMCHFFFHMNKNIQPKVLKYTFIVK